MPFKEVAFVAAVLFTLFLAGLVPVFMMELSLVAWWLIMLISLVLFILWFRPKITPLSVIVCLTIATAIYSLDFVGGDNGVWGFVLTLLGLVILVIPQQSNE